MQLLKYNTTKVIGPEVAAWPESQSQPLYWVSRKIFSLDGAVDSMDFSIVADRHYELYINGQLAVRQRNFFNGDEYLYAQTWDEQILPYLVQGENIIDVVIRSDPWRNKNYRCFMPMLMVEALFSCGTETVRLQTDEFWKVAVVENWRQQIAVGANGTIHFERIKIPPVEKAVLSGFSDDLNFTTPRVCDANSLPHVCLWNDPPKRIDTIIPCEAIAAGTYELPERVLIFTLDPPEAVVSANEEVILETTFDDSGGRQLDFAASSLVLYRIELNGELVGKNEDVPDKHQMQLHDFIVPVGQITTGKGCNHLRIVVSKNPQGWHPLRFTVNALPCLMEPDRWIYGDGRVANATVEPLELSEQIGAKFVRSPDDALSAMQKTPAIKLKKTCDRCFSLLDFGKVTTGRVKLKIHAASSGLIYLAYGFGHKSFAVDCQKMCLRAVDILEVSAGESLYVAFDVRTFRYLDILFEGFAGSVTVDNIQVEEPVFLDEGKSAFETSDIMVNRIWKASIRTAQLCGNELYMDNPEREHAQWSDPLAVGIAVGYYVFGEYKRPAKALREMSLTQHPDGQIAGYAPGRWFPRIPLQCHMSLFALSCHRYFMYTGDIDFANDMMDIILKMVGHWERHRKDNGLLSDLHTVFVDWGSHIYSYGQGSKGPTGALTTLNAYYLGVLVRSAEMAGFINRHEAAEKLLAIADSVRLAMRDQLYDSRIGLFRDGIDNKLAESNYSQTANALAVLFGAAPEGMEKKILSLAFSASRDIEMIPANALISMLMGESLFEAGCDELALTWLKDKFAPMLDNAPGTLWETWQPHASLCQGTGASPAYLFSRYLAGIYPLKPGYKHIGIDPHDCGLKNIESTLTTPEGAVYVKWERNGDSIKYHIKLPEGLRDCPVITTSSTIKIDLEMG